MQQPPHKLLAIPGPIEVSDEVLYANAHPSNSHMAPDFCAVFQDCLVSTRNLLYSKDAQVFLIAGSGTLGWDLTASNLVEAGENVLVISTGYFGDAFADCLKVYGANVDMVTAPVGDRPTIAQIEEALSKKDYKLVTFTHVDTSTGVLSDAKAICAAVKKHSPKTLTVLDGVCAVASEEIRMDDWQIDVVVSASQKGLGAPPGLCVLGVSQAALQVYKSRKSPPSSYYASFAKWLPIMEAYQAGNAAYFATPPTNLIYALQASLKSIMNGPISLEDRFKLHKESSMKIKQAALDMGLKLVPVDINAAANGMTAIYTPEGIKPTDVVPAMLKKEVILAAGLHKDIKTQYFRIGHMGITAIDSSRGDVEKIIKSLKETFSELGYKS